MAHCGRAASSTRTTVKGCAFACPTPRAHGDPPQARVTPCTGHIPIAAHPRHLRVHWRRPRPLRWHLIVLYNTCLVRQNRWVNVCTDPHRRSAAVPADQRAAHLCGASRSTSCMLITSRAEAALHAHVPQRQTKTATDTEISNPPNCSIPHSHAAHMPSR